MKHYQITLSEDDAGLWLAATKINNSSHSTFGDVASTPATALLSLVQRLGLERSGAKVLSEEEVEAVLERGRTIGRSKLSNYG